jgi:hypothetical protein
MARQKLKYYVKGAGEGIRNGAAAECVLDQRQYSP